MFWWSGYKFIGSIWSLQKDIGNVLMKLTLIHWQCCYEVNIKVLAMLLWSWLQVFLLVGCLTSQQQASVSQGQICSDNFMCCHTEIEVADQTFYLTQSQYTDPGPTSPSADPITPVTWQGSHWSANFWVTGMSRPGKIPSQAGFENPRSSALEVDALTTRPSRRFDIRTASFFFFCVPQLYLWGSPLLGEIFAYVTVS